MYVVRMTAADGDGGCTEINIFVTRSATTASEFCSLANAQLAEAMKIKRPEWTIREVKEKTRDIQAELAAWEAERRAVMTAYPNAWDSTPRDYVDFEFEEIEERD